jgi:hypothetical protein
VFIGGGLAVAIGGAWQLYLHFSEKQKEPTIVTASGGIAAGGNVSATVSSGGTAIVAGGAVTMIDKLTIQASDSPEIKQQKIEQAKSLIVGEILTNISNVDARLGFVEQASETDAFDKAFEKTREKVAPATKGIMESGYRQLIEEQKISTLRQFFNSRPLRSELGAPLINLLIQSNSKPDSVRLFYDQLAEVQSAAESLFDALSESTSPDNRDYRTRRVDLANDVFKNRSLTAHAAGLLALQNIGASADEVNTRLETLIYLEPRHLVNESQAQELLSKLLAKTEQLIREREKLVTEANNPRDEAVAKYEKLDEQLRIKPTDTWSQVVGKAISLRQLGRVMEAAAAFSRYAEMFTDSDPTASKYARIAQQLTLQMQDLSVDGGAYLYELTDGGAAAQAGLRIGDILLDYAGKTIHNMDDLMTIFRAVPAGNTVKIVYLRMDKTGRFTRLTGLMISGPAGAGFMPI